MSEDLVVQYVDSDTYITCDVCIPVLVDSIVAWFVYVSINAELNELNFRYMIKAYFSLIEYFNGIINL